jgi:hypothetical protein
MEKSMDNTMIQSISNVVMSLDWNAWITSIATFVLAILTFIYVWLTYKILNIQSDPCIVLTVVHDEDRSTILQLVAKNIGTGLAHDIMFEFSRPIPSHAFGLNKNEVKEISEMKDGPMIDGIPALGPGECRKIEWGQYGGLFAALGDKPIIATCKFKKNGKEMTPIQCPLDVMSFAGTVAVESPSSKVANELKKISKSIEYISTGFHKLKVEVVSLPPDKTNEESE